MKRIVSFSGEYEFLSNFSFSPLCINGNVYPTIEHAFQAAKTEDKAWQKRIQEAPTPGQAKRLGRKCPMKADWDTLKVKVMRTLVHKKFGTYVKFRQQLLETGDSELVEGNTWGDKFWGVDVTTGKGMNHLGQILMEVRKGFQNE